MQFIFSMARSVYNRCPDMLERMMWSPKLMRCPSRHSEDVIEVFSQGVGQKLMIVICFSLSSLDPGLRTGIAWLTISSFWPTCPSSVTPPSWWEKKDNQFVGWRPSLQHAAGEVYLLKHTHAAAMLANCIRSLEWMECNMKGLWLQHVLLRMNMKLRGSNVIANVIQS